MFNEKKYDLYIIDYAVNLVLKTDYIVYHYYLNFINFIKINMINKMFTLPT
jgi:hypothetical protein